MLLSNLLTKYILAPVWTKLFIFLIFYYVNIKFQQFAFCTKELEGVKELANELERKAERTSSSAPSVIDALSTVLKAIPIVGPISDLSLGYYTGPRDYHLPYNSAWIPSAQEKADLLNNFSRQFSRLQTENVLLAEAKATLQNKLSVKTQEFMQVQNMKEKMSNLNRENVALAEEKTSLQNNLHETTQHFLQIKEQLEYQTNELYTIERSNKEHTQKIQQLMQENKVCVQELQEVSQKFIYITEQKQSLEQTVNQLREHNTTLTNAIHTLASNTDKVSLSVEKLTQGQIDSMQMLEQISTRTMDIQTTTNSVPLLFERVQKETIAKLKEEHDNLVNRMLNTNAKNAEELAHVRNLLERADSKLNDIQTRATNAYLVAVNKP